MRDMSTSSFSKIIQVHEEPTFSELLVEFTMYIVVGTGFLQSHKHTLFVKVNNS